MNQSPLFIKEDELKLLLSETGTVRERLMGAGISSILIAKVVAPLHQILPSYKCLFDKEDYIDELDSFLVTLSGLWQLSVLATLGDLYMANLVKAYADETGPLDLFVLAKAVNLHLPAEQYGLTVDAIGNSSSSLIGSRWNFYTIPDPKDTTHSPDASHINYITYGLLHMLSTMCYQLKQAIPGYLDGSAESKGGEALLLKMATAITEDEDSDFEPLRVLTEVVDDLTKGVKRDIRIKKIKSLNLRIV